MEDPNALTAPAADEGSAPPEDSGETTPAPVETPEDSTPSEPVSEPATPREPTAAERRIQQLVAKQREAEREAAYWRGIAEGRKPEEAPAAPTETGPPRVEAFPIYDDYLVAKAKYEMRQELQRDEAARTAAAEKEQRAKADQTFMARMEEAAKTDPEILSVLQDRTLPVSSTMADIIRESEAGPQLLRHLSNNRQLAARLSQLTPFLAAKELGRLEAQILTTPKPEPPKKISQAPEPIKPVAASGKVTPALEELSMEEFVAKRNAKQFGTRR